ncbi:MAG TPA: protease HtpX [Gammaproteobacteria bacterium]|nr:protease HtpX [Gammaproteobacteria bacterium]|tara:strand:- start:237 stop:1118 length:882 start_codon:yes stop_codon:yes gene_type:complete
MTRLFLFIATNLAIVFLISITFQILGIDGLLMANGVDMNLNALLVMSAVIGFGGSFISLAISKWSAKRSMGVQVITSPSNPREKWLIETVKRQADQAGIGMPEVGIFPSNSVNAFATGLSRNNALVAVSSGLLSQMTTEEAEAVLGHEVAHVANGDMITLGLIQGVVNTFVIFLSRIIGFFVDRVILKNERGLGIGYFISSIVAQMILSVFATMIVMWFSRRREFRADEGGAGLAGREQMIAALKRLQGDSADDLPAEFAAFGISGGRPTGFRALFMSHPPLEERIAALEARL